MIRYTLKFTGRRRGSIGVFYRFTEVAVRVAPDLATASLALYDEYDHISSVKIVFQEPVAEIRNEIKS